MEVLMIRFYVWSTTLHMITKYSINLEELPFIEFIDSRIVVRYALTSQGTILFVDVTNNPEHYLTPSELYTVCDVLDLEYPSFFDDAYEEHMRKTLNENYSMEAEIINEFGRMQ